MIPADRKKLAALLPIAFVLGLAMTGADMYFGTGNGNMGAFILGILLFGGLAFEFLIAVHPLRFPRTPDPDFISGADYAQRQALANGRLRLAILRQAWVPALAMVVAGGALRIGILKVAGLAMVLCAVSAAVSLVMMGMVHWGWIPVSRKKFRAGEMRASGAFGAAAASQLIRRSNAMARWSTGWIPDPDRWLLRRKLLYLMRLDPIALSVYLLLTLVLAVQFILTWGFNLSAVFTMVGLLLSLTLMQAAFREADLHYSHCAHFLPPRRMDYRATLFLFSMVALVFLGQFALGCILHMGWTGALGSRAFWHVLVSGAALPFLVAWNASGLTGASPAIIGASPAITGAAGEPEGLNGRVILNFCYLGLAGWLFMFSWPGVAVTGVVLLIASWQCFRIATGLVPGSH